MEKMAKDLPPSRTAPQFVVRLPDETFRERLAEAAKSNNRSMNSEIVSRLESSLNGTPVWDEATEIERVKNEAGLHVHIEFWIQRCGALGDSVLYLLELLRKDVSEAEVQKASVTLKTEAERVIEAADRAKPTAAIDRLYAVYERRQQLDEKLKKLKNVPEKHALAETSKKKQIRGSADQP